MALVFVAPVATWAALAWRQVWPVVLALTLGATGFAYAAPKLLPLNLFVMSDQFLDARPPDGRTDGVFRWAPVVEGAVHRLAYGSAPRADAQVNPYGPDSPMFRALAGG